MGTPVPTPYPELEDDKWYRVGVDAYWDPFVPVDCENTYQGRIQCCSMGDVLQTWIDGGFECRGGVGFCVVAFEMAQRIVFIHGPYETALECTGDI